MTDTPKSEKIRAALDALSLAAVKAEPGGTVSVPAADVLLLLAALAPDRERLAYRIWRSLGSQRLSREQAKTVADIATAFIWGHDND